MWGDEDVGVEPRVKAAAATPSVGKAQAAPSGISPFAAAAPTATKTWGSDDSSDEEHGAAAPRTPHQAADEGEEQPSSLLDASTGCTTDFAAGMDMFSKARESAQAAAAAEAAAATAAAAPVDDFDPFAAPAEDPTAAPAAAPGALTLEQLSAMPVDAQKNALGNVLYPLVLAAVGEAALAGKITGMFLEMEAAALLPLLTAHDALGAKVQEAVEVLQAHAAAQVTATPTAATTPPPPPPRRPTPPTPSPSASRTWARRSRSPTRTSSGASSRPSASPRRAPRSRPPAIRRRRVA